MLSRTISEQPEALSVAWEAAVKVQVEDSWSDPTRETEQGQQRRGSPAQPGQKA